MPLTLPRTPALPCPALLRVARRVVWFKDPAETLADPAHFLAHVMTYGTIADIAAVRDAIGLEGFRAALEVAPPGIFDPRSWAYWNLVCGRSPPPPMPERVAVTRGARETPSSATRPGV